MAVGHAGRQRGARSRGAEPTADTRDSARGASVTVEDETTRTPGWRRAALRLLRRNGSSRGGGNNAGFACAREEEEGIDARQRGQRGGDGMGTLEQRRAEEVPGRDLMEELQVQRGRTRAFVHGGRAAGVRNFQRREVLRWSWLGRDRGEEKKGRRKQEVTDGHGSRNTKRKGASSRWLHDR